MEKICPICNGLQKINRVCPICGNTMENRGTLEDFYGPYSPFEDLDSIRMVAEPEEAGPDQCVHLVACPACGEDSRVPITLQAI